MISDALVVLEALPVRQRLLYAVADLHLSTDSTSPVPFKQVCDLYCTWGFPSLNRTREFIALSKLSSTRTNQSTKTIGVMPTVIQKYKEDILSLSEPSDVTVIRATGSYLSKHLSTANRIYLQRCVTEINTAYENECYNSCAVMLRRLLEVSLILVYQHEGKESMILDQSQRHVGLKELIALAPANFHTPIRQDVMNTMNELKELGDLSIHRIEYCAPRTTLDKLRGKAEALFQVLLTSCQLV